MTIAEFNVTTQHGPDRTDPRTIDWDVRRARAIVPFDVVDGLPINPVTAGLPAGRGQLWHWGEAVAADSVVFVLTPGRVRHLLMVERADGHGWALPGGMLDPGETPPIAAARELEEETGLVIHPSKFDMRAARGVPDPRAGANAWMATVPGVVTLTRKKLPAVRGLDDARTAAWFPAGSYDELVLALDGRVFDAHVGLLRETLSA
jgi:ADP-ribose pyrophosphatase